MRCGRSDMHPLDSMGVLNNNNFQGHIDPQARCILEASGLFKKGVQQGRSHFCAQSVLPVREHGKMARTPLAAFFNSPSMKKPTPSYQRQRFLSEIISHAVECFFRGLFKSQWHEPQRLVTDKLRSYDAANRTIMPTVPHLKSCLCEHSSGGVSPTHSPM